jgi:GTPase
MTAVVAIVGRPNVGKSTLFNRLIGERKALVHDRAGVTRDRIYGEFSYRGLDFVAVDTGGFEPDTGTDLFGVMRSQIRVAIEEADVLVLLVDRAAGLTPVDEAVAQVLRQTHKPVLLAVNKVDVPAHEPDLADFYKLGFDPMIPISAEHGRGIGLLLDAVIDTLGPAGDVSRSEPLSGSESTSAGLSSADLEGEVDLDDHSLDDVDLEEIAASGAEQDEEGGLFRAGDTRSEQSDASPDTEIRELRLSILGRPNVGKSTLANRLLGVERHLVHDAPGTTIDAIDSLFEDNGRTYRLVDTAGIRRRSRIDDRLETLAVSRAIRTIERCHVTLYVLDGTDALSNQDARLAGLAAERGRGLIFLVNRWDLVRDLPDRDSQTVTEEIRDALSQIEWAPILFISALTGKGCGRILPLADQVYTEFNRRIATAELNAFLREVELSNPPPQRFHHPVRIHYGTQARVRPPTFVLFSNTPEAIYPPYKRFLEHQLRERFGFGGSPIRIQIRRKRKPGEPSTGK